MAGDWSDEQNNAIVADYFAMLADDIVGRPYSKAEHNRLIPTRLLAVVAAHIELTINDNLPYLGRRAIGDAILAKRRDLKIVRLIDLR
jgi:hypothetical protein